MDDDKLIAYHEAGHYVAWREIRGDPGVALSVSIVPGEGYRGAFTGEEPSLRMRRMATTGSDRCEVVAEYDPAAIEGEIVVLYAGHAVASRLDLPRKSKKRALRGARTDYSHARGWAHFLPRRGRRSSQRALMARAQEVVREHWGDIEIIAAELLAERTINPEVADCILHIEHGVEVERAAHAVVVMLGMKRATALLARHGVTFAEGP